MGVANAFDLEAIIDTEDDGVTFDIHIEEVDVQLDYIVANTGSFVLDVIGGTIGGASLAFTGGSIALPTRSQVTLQTTTETIAVSGNAGQVISFPFSVQG